MLHVVVLAGGSGTRFWPKSRAQRPKQLLALGGDQSLLVETVERVSEMVPAERVWVVTNGSYANAVREQLPAVPADQVIAEPAGRDTAAAIGLGTLLVQARDPDASIVVLPADQRIQPAERFVASMRAAEASLAEDGSRIVVFGIRPDHPATGYGYIERDEPLGDQNGLPVHEVASFREKPDLATAESFVDSGRFFWNAGIFAYRAGFMRDCIAEHLPELHAGLIELEAHVGAADWDTQLAARYPELQKISIDYGVMERCQKRVVVETDFEWDDVGSWAAMARLFPADAEDNVSIGSMVAVDARRNIVDAGDGVVAILGVEGLVVVHTEDATLVAPRERAEEVKKLWERMRQDESLRRFT